MFDWLKKRPPVAPEPRQSVWTTDFEPAYDPLAWSETLKKSFQKLPSDFKMVNASGEVVAAMDAGNAGGSLGNPLALQQPVLAIDTIPYAQLNWYAERGFIGYQTAALIAQHWLVDKAITMPARDAMRHGYELATTDNEGIDPKILDYIKKRDKFFKIKDNCMRLVRFNRMFGIRIALPIIETKDPEFYVNPFNIDGVRPNSYRGISQIDPYWITPELSFQSGADPSAIEFYEPTWWRINGKRIHRSHLIIIKNGEVGDVLKPSYLYGGIPVPQKIAERVYAAERTANEAPQLALTKRTTIMKMDMSKAVANQTKFQQIMEFFALARDNFGVKAIDTDDEAEQFDTSLSEFSETIMTQYEIVAAASEVPMTKLMGTSPKGGLGSNGDYESESYHEFLESIQEHECAPLIERHHQLLMRSEIKPKFGKDFELQVVFNPVDTPTAKEQADINLVKAQTGNALVTSGAIDGIDERTRIIADAKSGYNGLADRVPEMPGDNDDDDTSLGGDDD